MKRKNGIIYMYNHHQVQLISMHYVCMFISGNLLQLRLPGVLTQLCMKNDFILIRFPFLKKTAKQRKCTWDADTIMENEAVGTK